MLWSQFSAIFANFRRKYFKNYNIGPWSCSVTRNGFESYKKPPQTPFQHWALQRTFFVHFQKRV
jgi:hypothetical protein